MSAGNARLRLIVGVASLAVLGAAIAYAVDDVALAAPKVDPAQSRALLPVIDNYLVSDRTGMISDDSPSNPVTIPGVTAICTERIIEIRPQGPLLRVGLVASCGAYRRRGSELLLGPAEADAAVELTLSPASGPDIRVTAAAYEPDDVTSSWLNAHFSRAGIAEFRRVQPADPTVRARTALGLPAAAPAVEDAWDPAFSR